VGGQPVDILADVAYTTAQYPQMVTPYKHYIGELTLSQHLWNTKVGSDRVIIENTFGRLKMKFKLLWNGKMRGNRCEIANTIWSGLLYANWDIEMHPCRSGRAKKTPIQLEGGEGEEDLEEEAEQPAPDDEGDDEVFWR
jgi:hypothetical protein